ncbi:VanZ family protein [Candidatus Microthrix parvicella]|uniref:VanZ family protein n=1 Tax=Candidatus Neomicrothrix parvicella TaxID=41950 RepID=UPI003B967EB5
MPPSDRLEGLLLPQAGSTDDPVFWAQLVFNVIWFVPVGRWVADRLQPRWAPFASALALGSMIELLQLFATSTRYPSLLDVALNTLGGALGGGWLQWQVRRSQKREELTTL